MDQEIKRKWVEALRSGKYQQGRGSLEENGKFCCLGVLCEVVGVTIKDGDGRETDAYMAIEKLGVTDPHALWVRNDKHKHSFSEIADYIDQREHL